MAQNVEEVTKVYGHVYQLDSVSPRACEAAGQIVDVINTIFRPASVLDVGSGGGSVVRAFRQRGVDARGVDGSAYVREVSSDPIDVWDLREFYQRGKPVELVTCFDTAEHIEAEYADTLCDTLCANVARGGYLILGPAPEGQDGLGHVNCQHPCYWIYKLETRGFKLLPNLSEEVRMKIKAQPEANFLWWIAKNLMVFRRKE